MKIKVEDLTPMQLCWAVASLREPESYWVTTTVCSPNRSFELSKYDEPEIVLDILTEQHISVMQDRSSLPAAYIADTDYDPGDHLHYRFVQTNVDPATAILRCYVASKLGNEVEIPKELT